MKIHGSVAVVSAAGPGISRTIAAAPGSARSAAVVGDITGRARGGIVVAAYQMCSDLGAVVGPITAGLIIDATGSFALAFLVGTAAGLIGLVTALVMRETLPLITQRAAAHET